jgi:hypothetical protein
MIQGSVTVKRSVTLWILQLLKKEM